MGKKKQKQASQQQSQQSAAQSRLNALFHMSIEHSDREKLKNVKPMDAQNREFLEGALKEHMEDPIQKLKAKIVILQQFAEGKLEDDEEVMEALEEISYQTEIIDFANDFHKLGGLRLLLQQVIPKLIKTNKLAVLEKALEPIDVCAQNNPYIQNVIMTEFPDLIEQLLQLLASTTTATPSATSATSSSSSAAPAGNNKETVVKRKTLTAISAILSNNEKSSDFLVAHEHAIKLFLQLLQTQTDQSIKRKTLFLILNMIIANPAKVSEAFISAGLLPVLLSIIDPRTAKAEQSFVIPDNDTLENALHVLDNMLQVPALKQSLSEKLKQEGYFETLNNLASYLAQQVRTPAEDEFMKIRELTAAIKSNL